MSGVLQQRVDAGAPVFGVQHLNLMALQDAGQGEDVAHVVVHDEHAATRQFVIHLPEPLQFEPLVLRQRGFGHVQDAGDFGQQAVGRMHLPNHRSLAQRGEAEVLQGAAFGRVGDHVELASVRSSAIR